MKLSLILLAALFGYCVKSDQPGAEIRISKSGLDYANSVAGDLLNKEIRNIHIPDIDAGDIKATNIHVTRFENPTYTYSLSPPTTFSWNVKGGEIDVESDARACKKVIIKICQDVKVKASAKDVTVSLSAQLGHLPSGHPAITSSGCQASISALDVKIKGGVIGWIIDLFHKKIANQLKPVIEKTICEEAQKFIMNDVNNKLASFPVSVSIADLINLDYGLTSDPVVQNQNVDALLKGIVSHPTIKDPSPYPQTPLALSTEQNKMLYVWASEKIANDIFFYMHKARKLSLHLTQDTPEVGKFLRLRCGEEKCLGSLIPEYVEKLPKSVEAAELLLITATAPILRIRDGQASIKAKGSADLYVNIPEEQRMSRDSIALASLGVEANFEISIRGTDLIGRVEIGQFDVRITNSVLDKAKQDELEKILRELKPVIEENINAILDGGIPIPIINGIDLENSQIRLLEQTVQVESDVKYTS